MTRHGDDKPATLREQRRALLAAYHRKRRRELRQKQAWSRIFALYNAPR